MSILEKYDTFVKEQIAFHEKRAKEYQSNPFRHNKHTEVAQTFRSIATDIEQLEQQVQFLAQQIHQKENSPKPAQLRLALSSDDIVGLPDELLNELSTATGDRTDFAILTMMQEAGGVLTLDRILIGLYRRTKEINKRDKLTSRMYRMVQKGMVYPVPSKKGVYSLDQISEQEFLRRFSDTAAIADSTGDQS